MTTIAPPKHRAGANPAQPTATSAAARHIRLRNSSSGMDPRIEKLKEMLSRLTPVDFIGITGYRTADICLFAKRVAAGVAFCELRSENWRAVMALSHFDIGHTDHCLRAILSGTDFDMACKREGIVDNAAVSLGFFLTSHGRHGIDQACHYELLTAMWRRAAEFWPECVKVA